MWGDYLFFRGRILIYVFYHIENEQAEMIREVLKAGDSTIKVKCWLVDGELLVCGFFFRRSKRCSFDT